MFWMRCEERDCSRYITWLLEFSVMQNVICLFSRAQFSTRAEMKGSLSTGELYKPQKQQLTTKRNPHPVALTGARPHSLPHSGSFPVNSVSSLSGLPAWMVPLSEGACLLGPARLKELRQASPPIRNRARSSQHSLHYGNAESLLSVTSHDPLLQIPQAERDL